MSDQNVPDDYKQVIMVRMDLPEMTPGKAIAQACHASQWAAIYAENGWTEAPTGIEGMVIFGADPEQVMLRTGIIIDPDVSVYRGPDFIARGDPMAKYWKEYYRKWRDTLYKKITFKVGSEAKLLTIARQAHEAHLPVFVVHDAGLTQLAPDTITACGIGPGPVALINGLTRRCSLY